MVIRNDRTRSIVNVFEGSWGESFRAVFGACLLQSVTPCVGSDFTINGNTLKINPPLRYTITLVRI